MTRTILFKLASTAATIALTVPAQAQQVPPPVDPRPAAPVNGQDVQDEGELGAEITVTGQRERGSVPSDIQPEQVLRPADIRAYGVSSITDLLSELAPQLGSGRGRDGGQPVVLLNGRRISGFREIRDLPTEAIERTEILPPEAAQQLGYRADQRVVNIVLRRRFRAYTGEVQGGGSTGGARFNGAADANLVRIARDKRLNVNLHYDAQTAIYEDDRDILPTPTSPSEARAFRTLSPATRKGSVNATYSQPILGNVTASVNVNIEATGSDSELGLGLANLTVPGTNPFAPFATTSTISRYLIEGGARDRSVQTDTRHAGVALNGDVGDWRWSVTGNYDRNASSTFTDTSFDLTPLAARIAAGDPTLDPFARFDPASLGAFRQDYARSVANVADIEGVANGPIFDLPAGKARISLKSGFEYSDFDARAIRSGVTTTSEQGRDTGSGQVRVDLPITSRNRAFLPALGNLSANANYAYDQVSDFGLLSTWGYGLNWSPISQVSLLASVSREDDAPSTSQLGNPVIVTPDARIFDFVTGTSVDVNQIDGGNANLLAEQRRITNLTFNITPLRNTELNLTAEYTRTRVINPISSIPAPTAAVEAAFPDRFTRNAAGQLTRFDNRPVNFSQSDQEQIRWGVNFSRRIGPAPQPGRFGGQQRPRPQGAPAPTPGQPQPDGATPTIAVREGGQPGGDGPRFGGPGGGQGGGFGGRGGFGGGRLQLSVFHTWRMKDTILIRPGLPELDLLDGDATSTRGGSPEHRVEFNAGVTKGGYGFRVSGNWQSGTFVRGGTARAPTDLNFAPLTTVTARVFADFNPTMAVVRDHPWLAGTRVQLAVRNLFDSRLRVTDAAGIVPINYQPDLLDPVGRAVTISLRKLFFSRPQPGQRR